MFSKVEVAGPGFINLFLSQSFWAGVVLGACANKEYGRTDHGKGAKYNVEFVSANPPAPCTWATPAAAHWATVWPLCWTGPATM